VEEQGGVITVSSAVGKGAGFSFTWPAEEHSVDLEQAKKKPELFKVRSKSQKWRGCKAQTLKMYNEYFEMAITNQTPYFWLALPKVEKRYLPIHVARVFRDIQLNSCIQQVFQNYKSLINNFPSVFE